MPDPSVRDMARAILRQAGSLTADALPRRVMARRPISSRSTATTLRNALRSDPLFDFGDHLTHDITVLGTLPVPGDGSFPRVAEAHGEAPPQYPNLEEDEDDDDWDE